MADSGAGAFQRAFPDRLRRVIATIHLAGAVRAAAGSHDSVQHYLTGRRPPTRFLAALVREHGVNPEWLLQGQGAPFVVEEVANARMANETLTAAIEKLATLCARSLRALEHHNLVAMSAQLRDLYREYEAASSTLERAMDKKLEALSLLLQANVEAGKIQYAVGIERAMGRLEPLCRSANTRLRYLSYRGQLRHFLGDTAGAARAFAEVLSKVVILLDKSRPELAMSLANLGIGHYSARRFDAVARTARSGLPLLTMQNAPSAVQGSTAQGLAMLHFVRAAAALECAEPSHKHLNNFFASAQVFDRRLRTGTFSNRIYVWLVCGLFSFKEALSAARRGMHELDAMGASHMVSVLLQHVAVHENQEALAQVSAWSSALLHSEATERDVFMHAYAQAISQALERGELITAHEFMQQKVVAKNLLRSSSPLYLVANIACCQLHILGKDFVSAREEFQRVQAAIIPSHPPPDRLLWMALHHRNALRLEKHDKAWAEPYASTARAFFEQLKRNGYHGLFR